MSVLHLTEDTFEEAVAHGLTLVDFWADWCGPCKMLAPTIEALGEQYEGKAAIAKVDIMAYPGLAARFGVMSIPTVLLFQDGLEIDRKVGLMSAEAYTETLDTYL